MANSTLRLDPIPDETIFGLCIQVGVLKGARTYADCLRLVFDDQRKFWFDPNDADPKRLASLLQDVAVDSAESLLSNHSIWPYLIAFQQGDISDVLKHGERGGELVRFFGLTGCPAITERKIPRYCKLCAAEQIDKYGRSTWLRSHQLPGVTVCFEHGETLWESNFSQEKFAKLSADVKFPDIDSDFFEVDEKQSFSIDPDYLSPERLWAQISRDCLFSNGLLADKEKVFEVYKNGLLKSNLIRDGKVDFKGVQCLFKDRYGDLFSKKIQTTVGSVVYWEWLPRLLNGVNYFRHPVRHLMLIGAVFGGFPTAESLA